MDYAYRIRVQRVLEVPNEFEVRVSQARIRNDVRFDDIPGIPSFKNRFTRPELLSVLTDVMGDARAADALVKQADSGDYSEGRLPQDVAMDLLDRLCGGRFLGKS